MWSRWDYTDPDDGAEEGQPVPGYVPVTIEECLPALLSERIRIAAREEVTDALGTFLEQVVSAIATIDPWPELTRADLRVMISGRESKVPNYSLREMVENYPADMALSMVEKTIASHYRDWLLADFDKRRKALARALALVKSAGLVAG